ncbi:sensor histidine kinase [Tengunoibacter tsumagoiensis]|uniref:histidine kinase n=1 Tax=Tengunoibacter tsumagoiensis TaxID=2014871 RepID=A0A402A8M4_9CHLR|nr:HAMP domain-containing sensor histidine kinase [Tengunoibacter tsumagoiensis]GCE15524.1 two-component sensor histidine kinase [Tengunoibacter tsumagoiensis]
MKWSVWRVWSPGIRIQVMLWSIAVFLVLLLSSDLVLYLGLKHSLEVNMDATLQAQAQQLANGISNKNGTVQLDTESPEIDTPAIVSSSRSQNIAFRVLIRLLDRHGHLLRTTPAFHSLAVPWESVTRSLSGAGWQGTVSNVRGQEVRLYSMPLTNNGVVFAVLQVGTSLEQTEVALRSLLMQLLLLVPLLFVLGSLGSYFLVKRAFHPIEVLTCTAQEIEAGDLHRRVPLPSTRDEVYRLADTFNRMLERLETAFVRQRRFVADASHELRTPTTVISNMAEMALLNAASRDECAATLQTIITESQRLGHLVNDLLALARVDERQTRLERERVRLDLLACAVATHLQPIADERQITLEVQASEPTLLAGDEARLIQVLLNLSENALSYTHPGGRVCLTVTNREGQACLIVQDTGIGMASEHLPHIFERFYRIDPARVQSKESHSGLGLSIVEWVVRAHAGSISVESQVGKGSTFTVMLPFVKHEISCDD